MYALTSRSPFAGVLEHQTVRGAESNRLGKSAAALPAARPRRTRLVLAASTGGLPSYDEGRSSSDFASSFEKNSSRPPAAGLPAACETGVVEEVALVSEVCNGCSRRRAAAAAAARAGAR